jgi:hypothetical protein
MRSWGKHEQQQQSSFQNTHTEFIYFLSETRISSNINLPSKTLAQKIYFSFQNTRTQNLFFFFPKDESAATTIFLPKHSHTKVTIFYPFRNKDLFAEG